MPDGAIYTCPMHPEIRQVGPGSCPICGMALEPEAGGDEDGGELADMTRRFWISLVLALPVVAIDMGGHFGFWHSSGGAARLAQFVLTTPVVLWGGWPFFVRGAQSLRTLNLNMFTLIAMGTGVAYVFSVVAAAAPDVFPAIATRRPWRHPALFRGRRRHHRPGPARASARIARARLDVRRHQRADRARTQNRPARQDDGTDEDVPLDTVAAGDRLRVRPGEKVPVDGVVEDGSPRSTNP